MNTKLYINGHECEFKSFKFAGGEIQVRGDVPQTGYGAFKPWSWPSQASHVWIKSKIKDADTLMEVLMLTDAVRRYYKGTNPRIELHIPYVPYARQDRVCYPGEALSLKVFCDIINAQNYDLVRVLDAHSDVALALLNNVDHVESWEILQQFVPSDSGLVLVAPDAGATKKVLKCAQKLKLDMVTAEKVRDPKNGSIKHTNINLSLYLKPNQRFLIIDDICDGGRTFVELAKEIRKHFAPNEPNINLYVSHGIFSQGFDVFNGLIDHIYVANSFVDDVPKNVTRLSF